MISLSTLTRNAIIEAVVTSVIDTAENAVLTLFTGDRPYSPDMAYAGNALISFRLANPSFSAANNGSAIAYDGITALSDVQVDGDATWFRLYNGEGSPVLDGSVTDVDGDGDIKLNSTSMTIGGKVLITRLIIRIPVSNS